MSRSFGSYVVGADASRLLSTVSGISEIKIEKQFIDAASISYESAEAGVNVQRIDDVLREKGMQRVR